MEKNNNGKTISLIQHGNQTAMIKDNPTGVTMQFLMKKTNLSRTTVNSRIKALRSLDLVCTRTIPNHAISYTVNYSNDVVIQDR